ncbi:MAG: hypothetical protein ACI4TF_02285 [Oliverpabstia sp.]
MIFKKSIAIMLVCTMLLPLSACGKGNEENKTGSEEVAVVESTDPEEMAKEEVETAVGEFQYACQTSDVDAMLDCLDPGFAQSLKSGRLLLNWMSTEKNSDEVIMNTMLIAIMNIADISVDLSTMNIEIEEITLKEDMATVSATLELDSTSGVYRDKITMRMTKDNNTWYITGVTT